MATKTKDEEQSDQEQTTLCELTPENEKEMAKLARAYKKHMRERMAANKKEVDYKQKIIAAAKEAGIVALPDGSFKFKAGDATISIKPRDELIKVKFDDDEDEDGDEE